MELLITHKDWDGLACADIARQVYPDVEIHFTHHGDPVPWDKIGYGLQVVIADFSYDRETILEIKSRTFGLEVYDHHESAEANLKGIHGCYFDMTKAGCRMLWEGITLRGRFHPIYQYIEDRDLWKWTHPYSREINATIRSYPRTLEGIAEAREDFNFDSFIEAGEAILRNDRRFIEGKTKHVHLVTFRAGGTAYEIPLLNNGHLISEVGHALAEDHPFSVQYFITPERVVFCLRSDRQVNCREVAEHFGGGGHPGAAGFQLSHAIGFKMINELLNG